MQMLRKKPSKGFCANIGICGQARLTGLSVRVRRNEGYNIVGNLDFGLDFLLPGKGVHLYMKKC